MIQKTQQCQNCRHFGRLKRRNPFKLWQRQCMCAGMASTNGLYKNIILPHPGHSDVQACPLIFQTAYSPQRREIIYDQTCYQSEII